MSISRERKLQLNTITGTLSQIVALICGFIVPRLILEYYGSAVNGMVSSITQFLNFISLAELGMGVVVQSSMYKPLAIRDMDELSRIILSSNKFFSKIGVLLVGYVIILSALYPLIINESYGYIYTCTLVLSISISTFVQYYICMSYRLLVMADQVGYINLSLIILTQIINTGLCVILAKNGATIQELKFLTSLVLLIQPLLLYIYVKKNYDINKKIQLNGEPIKQKWNGIAQHLAYVVLENTDIVVLTFLSTLANVSVFNVYYLVIKGLKSMILSAMTGVQSLLGNMYAKEEQDKLIQFFSYYEWVMHIGVVFIYTCSCLLIVPFVEVYTYGITDVNYIVPILGFLLSIAQMSYCLRLPYNAMVLAAGHYKQTQSSAIIEAIINIVLSVILVFKYDLIGVATGTFVAMIYRTGYLAWYLSHNILYRNLKYFFKHVIVDVIVIIISFFSAINFAMTQVSYVSWCFLAIKVAIVVGSISLIINFIAYPKLCLAMIKKKRG